MYHYNYIMDTKYDIYIETIEGIEQIEKDLIKDNKIKRCCSLSLEFIKAVLICLKNNKKSK